jgi:hypothetical protein
MCKPSLFGTVQRRVWELASVEGSVHRAIPSQADTFPILRKVSDSITYHSTNTRRFSLIRAKYSVGTLYFAPVLTDHVMHVNLRKYAIDVMGDSQTLATRFNNIQKP